MSHNLIISPLLELQLSQSNKMKTAWVYCVISLINVLQALILCDIFIARGTHDIPFQKVCSTSVLVPYGNTKYISLKDSRCESG